MELSRHPLEQHARRAYEWSRLRRALLGALPILVLAVPAAALAVKPVTTMLVGGGLMLLAVAALWFGHGLPRATALGIAAGALPLGLVLCTARVGHACAGPWCMKLCLGSSALGGAAAGALISIWAFEKHFSLPRLATALGFGLLTASMASTCVGVWGVLALAAGFAVGGGVLAARKFSGVALVVALASTVASAQQADGALATFIDEALATRPELDQARADVVAAQERVPQAESWADPMLQVGVQNDTFTSWQVGMMETSWVLFMASQTIPFPGKAGLRGAVASVDVSQRQLALERTRLSTIADVRRAYVSMQVARARLELLSTLTTLLEQAVAVASSRYESNEGPQSDILRARLELARLGQQRVVAEVEVTLQRQALNRLRGRPLDARVDGAPFASLAFPVPPAEEAAVTAALERSPEVLAARAATRGAEHGKALSAKQALPDLSVGAGVMVRGRLAPMWTVTLGVPLPIFAGSKQARGVAEANAVFDSASKNVEAVEQLVRLRVAQRLAVWAALSQVWRTSQDSLRADAEATSTATLTQYRIGKVPFSSVLDATSATIGVLDASYVVLADAWRLAIAQDELSLSEVTVAGVQMGSAAPSATPSSSVPKEGM
ncbi:MAG: TolC family protein [Myxococcales bacterium]|nr:TolC family protein [Myxococcales bacterium]